MSSSGQPVTVTVKSAWASKVNWLAGATAFLVSANELLNQVAPFLPAPYAHDATIAITIIGGLSTIIAKTFYTTTVTPSAAAKL